jgi:hypothetical protein
MFIEVDCPSATDVILYSSTLMLLKSRLGPLAEGVLGGAIALAAGALDAAGVAVAAGLVVVVVHPATAIAVNTTKIANITGYLLFIMSLLIFAHHATHAGHTSHEQNISTIQGFEVT